MTPRHLVAVLLLAAGPLAGCGLEDPYTTDQPADPTAPPAARFEEQLRRGQARGDELAPPAPAGDSAPLYAGMRAAAGPERLVREFCAQWANWSYRTIARQQRRLAQLATDGLAAQLAPSASQRALPGTLARDRFAVRGEVVAVDLLAGAERRGAICVTREEEYERGREALGDGAARVYRARLERGRGGWRVAAWQPQP